MVAAYIPNASRGLKNIDYRVQQWDPDFRIYLKKLMKKKPVILGGDLNIAHTSNDLKNDVSNWNKTAGYTDREIEQFNKLIDMGFEDSYRRLYPKKEAYTFWTYMGNARSRNVGWRLDYFMLQVNLRKF